MTPRLTWARAIAAAWCIVSASVSVGAQGAAASSSAASVNETGSNSVALSPAQGSSDTAARQSTHPLPARDLLKFEPQYTFPHGASRYTAQILFEPVMPYSGLLVPELEIDGFRSIARIKVFAKSFQNSTTTASGLTDLTFADVVVHQFGPLEAALGFATVFPMATTASLGQGKWQFGPAAAASVDITRTVQLGAFEQTLWSVAGDSQQPSLGYITLQPLVGLHLPEAMTIYSNAQMSFYWQGGQSTVPVNLGLAHGFGPHFAGQMEGTYTLSGQGKHDIQGAWVLNFQP